MKQSTTYTLLGMGLIVAGGLTIAQSRRRATEKPFSLSSYLGVVAYPGAMILSQENETVLEATASLEELYVHVHDQLTARGWERLSFKEEDEELEAHYIREGERLTVELEKEGENRYEVEFELEFED